MNDLDFEQAEQITDRFLDWISENFSETEKKIILHETVGTGVSLNEGDPTMNIYVQDLDEHEGLDLLEQEDKTTFEWNGETVHITYEERAIPGALRQ